MNRNNKTKAPFSGLESLEAGSQKKSSLHCGTQLLEAEMMLSPPASAALSAPRIQDCKMATKQKPKAQQMQPRIPKNLRTERNRVVSFQDVGDEADFACHDAQGLRVTSPTPQDHLYVVLSQESTPTKPKTSFSAIGMCSEPSQRSAL